MYSYISAPSRLQASKTLAEGQRVNFEVTQGQKGPQRTSHPKAVLLSGKPPRVSRAAFLLPAALIMRVRFFTAKGLLASLSIPEPAKPDVSTFGA